MASFDDLIRHLQRNIDDIDEDVDEILKNNSNEFVGATVKKARSVMTQGYWTGNLARQVKAAKTGKLEYTITSNAHYSGFLEYGTRYMQPYTFMQPVYKSYEAIVTRDLKRLIEN